MPARRVWGGARPWASVLSRFFALYTTANSFVRLTLRQGGETVKRWPAMTGRQCLI